jgi:hypothetical protein
MRSPLFELESGMICRKCLWIYILLLGIALSPLSISAHDNESEEKVIVGWLEKAYLPEYNFALRAKMDTGAKNSSIHAADMEYIAVEGKPPRSHIRFRTIDTKGNNRTIEAEIVREVYIKKSRLDTETPVTEGRVEIELEVCLAGITKRIRANLTNREGMNYRMILGRTALESHFVVDVSQSFIAGKKCRKGRKKKITTIDTTK